MQMKKFPLRGFDTHFSKKAILQTLKAISMVIVLPAYGRSTSSLAKLNCLFSFLSNMLFFILKVGSTAERNLYKMKVGFLYAGSTANQNFLP